MGIGYRKTKKRWIVAILLVPLPPGALFLHLIKLWSEIMETKSLHNSWCKSICTGLEWWPIEILDLAFALGLRSAVTSRFRHFTKENCINYAAFGLRHKSQPETKQRIHVIFSRVALQITTCKKSTGGLPLNRQRMIGVMHAMLCSRGAITLE